MMNHSQKEIRKIIAQRLKTARENAGYISTQGFCEKYGFPLTCYQKHENGMLSMIASEIIDYCLALDISVCYLMLGEEAEDLRKLAVPKKRTSS